MTLPMPPEAMDLLSTPRGKYDVPTLITYPAAEGVRRHVVVEIGGPLIEGAWAAWCAVHPADPEAFLMSLYAVTGHEIPRMYRAVSNVVLEAPPAPVESAPVESAPVESAPMEPEPEPPAPVEEAPPVDADGTDIATRRRRSRSGRQG